MTCLTCQRRKRICDQSRPRCAACKTSHLKCRYDYAPLITAFEINSPASMQQIYSRSTVYPGVPEDPAWEPTYNRGAIERETNSRLNSSMNSAPISIPNPTSESQDFSLGPSIPSIDFSTSEALHPLLFNELSYLDMDFTRTFIAAADEWNVPSEEQASSFSCAASPRRDVSAVQLTREGDETLLQRPTDSGDLPVHLLSQHFSRQLTGRFSFKSADWTFYNFFFHRFTNSHPWVLSAILCWTSASLFYSGRWKDLAVATFHYDQCLSQIVKIFGRSFNDVESLWPSEYDPVQDQHLSAASTEDIDALFVSCFFLALFDQMAAVSGQIRKIFHFISHVLKVPNVRGNMGGVRSRVSTWFCILESKGSAFQQGDGAILSSLGGQDGLTSALRASYDTLQKVYSVTYPDEERTADELQLPLLQRMLELTTLLSVITLEKSQLSSTGSDVSQIRAVLDAHAQALRVPPEGENLPVRVRSTWLVLLALYNTVEISFSRHLDSSDLRHSADTFAVRIIQLAHQLDVLRGRASLSTPPPTKIWPLPLVMAAIEVRDPIYHEWVLYKLGTYAETAGQHYALAKLFVERVWQKEEEIGTRVDCAVIMTEICDGLVL